MKVSLIAQTTVDFNVAGKFLDDHEDANSSDFLAEFAGRSCYESWDRPNNKTATNDSYLGHILDVGHFSVLEHASATFYIQGVSRSLTHELVRHRHLSFSQRSQRYVDESNYGFAIPPDLIPLKDKTNVDTEWTVQAIINDVVARANSAYEAIAEIMVRNGHPRKEARQAARSVLPNGTETNIVVTGNMRAWREFIQKRWHVAADKEIQELAGLILDKLMVVAANTFQDIGDAKYGITD